ncbi:MAG: Transcriptional activator protein CzcR [Chroococcidiopsis cubana SAG 39.79]|jgi:DNA-binding response OmpR family regulator|uniref:Two component transcriptional regulator, winged helix family n=2 Tax=Chroococcidiopsis TaxID=54298 RepID=K9TU71_CHRTP|nr:MULTISPECIES: response regulator transcription factor [Chroococcidiopsis]MBE9015384.1 response regulator transcription factor [Chroococcidiopsidales cyanobacterium LEGE 13417]PSB44237.1 DNA-binding response regulator [Cyanosarcina cf. burmensis CCALA 770]AFY86110.1 two component transcriptional regulator, winged helix family [Chroococcidiopsis thermalis PCC 7203]MDZ4873336.1 Transcriptional activator protein CzcR [Chroococcidiopsis cubana SAG 39.79]PSB62457.1 DNA-binding response regulator 
MSRILIVEDEPRISAFIEKGLKANGYTVSVVRDGDEALLVANSKDFDLMILDIGLPRQDGWTILSTLRGQGEYLPIVILTARDDVNDKVAGLEGGADDYMTKPFRFEELLARVRLRLRDKTQSVTKEIAELKAGNLVLDLRLRQVRIGDRSIELSAKEFTLIETFLRHPNQVLSREQLLSAVWGYDYDPGSNIVDVYVGYLRKKISSHLIETVRGMGYRFVSQQ